MWPALEKPVIFAHRGASTHAPENTLAAFELAFAQGADGIELDAKLSADGEVVVIHDTTVERTTNGQGRVADLSLSALRELDAGSSFSDKFAGERIPTLDEIFAAVGDKLFINVELTNYRTRHDDLAAKVANLVIKHGLEERILFSSFLPRNLRITAQLLPDTPRGLLALPKALGWWMRSIAFPRGDYQALHPKIMDVSQEMIRQVHQAGRRVNVWTVNDAADMRRLKAWGADGIFTDDPPLALKIFGRGK
ncbi:MAG: hypothetical protein L3J16_01145 [Anaerolineales bacterium]|nr:hypothetical protein [Anaerolineales bacterium]